MSPTPTTLERARALRHDLRALGAIRAPRDLLPRVRALVLPADAYVRLESAIGPLYVAFNPAGVSAVMRAADGPSFEAAFQARFGRPVRAAAAAPPALERAVRGERARLAFDLRGLSEFEQAVLRKALEIPRGEVRSYAWIAREIGRPKAVRAVGTALGRNPVPLLIPCHRVVRADGRIGEYALGSQSKRDVLAAEGVEPDTLETLARAGVRYLGSATTGIYCLPTCRHARRIGPRHARRLRSDAEAAAAGFRPCRVCRPAAVAV